MEDKKNEKRGRKRIKESGRKRRDEILIITLNPSLSERGKKGRQEEEEERKERRRKKENENLKRDQE